MILVDEFYKVGPGPSSSHTIGPMRITYDFYQRCTKLPADQLAKATGLKVHLFGSLSATGKGHGTERASLAGLIGKEPATVDPLFLDEMRDKPDQTYPGEARRQDVQRVARRTSSTTRPRATSRIPNTMTCKLMAGDKPCLEQEYYSVGGGFIEWKGYKPPKKGPPKYPVRDDEGAAPARREEQALDRAGRSWRTRSSISGKSEAEVNAFLDKISSAMLATVKSGLSMQGGRAARPDQAADEGRRPSTSGPWTTSTRATAPSACCRPARSRRPRRTRAATWSSRRRPAVRPA